MKRASALLVLSGLLLGGCVTAPTGPSVMALPGTGKSFDQFRIDDMECRQYALNQVGGATADQTATDSALRSAAFGTLVGAVAGAAIGGRDSAGVGAGTGLLVGSMAGADAARHSARGSQRQYDNAYIQCMYAKGEQVPVSGAYSGRRMPPAVERPDPPPSGGSYLPPPPPGYAQPPSGR